MSVKESLRWSIIKKYAQRAGKEVLAMAEAAYLTLNDPEVSWRHKSVILGALVYLLTPVDALPDFLPGGYADDLSMMLSAVLAAGHVGKKHLKECRLKHGLAEKNPPAKKDSEQ